ncbi:MAG: V-type ATPase subunit [Polyangiaceae bacterium]
MNDLDYGNARLAVRRSRLLTGDRLVGLLDLGFEGLVAALSDSPLGPDLREALLRFEGLRMIQEALRRHLGRSLTDAVSFYEGEARRDLELLASRWDLQNLVTLLRGQARRVAPDELVSLMIPTATLDEAALRELAEAPGLRAAIERMVVWGLPSPSGARRLLEAWRDYERHDDVARLEHRLVELAAQALDTAMHDHHLDDVLARPLRLAVDLRQLMTALRLFDAFSQGDIASVSGPHRFADLPGGYLDSAALRAAIERPNLEEAVAALTTAAADHPFLPFLHQLLDHRSLERLHAELEAWILTDTVARARHADPLSLAVPVGYVFAKEAEHRNLRLVAAAVTGRLDRTEALSHLIH